MKGRLANNKGRLAARPEPRAAGTGPGTWPGFGACGLRAALCSGLGSRGWAWPLTLPSLSANRPLLSRGHQVTKDPKQIGVRNDE